MKQLVKNGGFLLNRKRKKCLKKINIRLAKELMANSNEDFKKYLDEIGKTMQNVALQRKFFRKY